MPADLPPLQTRFVHAAHYASLTLQTCEHLFPGRTVLQISPSERRLLDWSLANLLAESRWRVESIAFADAFAMQPGDVMPAPPGTELGAPLAPRPDEKPARQGQYL